jgi:DNA-binding winged helix-turn-helix (wHTH) protein/TolB-like protein
MRFGLFEFDANSGALSRDGRPVRLQPQPARVLAMLARRAGEIVTRDALRQEIWSDGTFVDFERGLNFCVAQIRAALADSAESPRFIETVPKRGYRFIAPVQELGDRDGSAEAGRDERRAADRGVEPGRHRLSLGSIAALAVLALVTAALVIGASRAGRDPRIRVAVVPFDNETGMNGFDQVARAVADETVARMATPDRTSALSVIGNAAVLYQPRAFRDLKRIGSALGADYIVLAQMKSDGSKVRLIAHLIRVRDQAHVWANTYDRQDFTLDVQAEIAEAIAGAVTARLASSSQTPTS